MAKRFKCDVCNKKFPAKSNLVSHQHVHSTDTPFACPQCPYRGKTKKYLSRHTRQVHKERTGEHKCTVCGKFFLHQSSLKVHAMVHTGEKPHSCNVCGKTFRVTYSLNTHMLIHTKEKPFQCVFCDYACRDSSTLRKHQNKHMGLEKIYECKICNKGYKSRKALKMHIAETHLDVDLRKFPCSRCDKVFKSKTHRKIHIDLVHERALVCNCPICGRRLLNRNNLPAHMRTHLDERPFSCSHPGCKIAFKDKNSLTKHSVIHNPDQHFACTHCGRKFARKTHVQRHERVMHVERRRGVQCDYCGTKFYSKNYLTKHIQTKHVHRQKFKYICDKCGLVTHNKPSIVMHLKYGHANDHDLQCKICDNKKVYKRHIYLKLHYWNSHSMRYKITRKAANNKANKKEIEENPSVEIKVEPIEAESYEEVQLLEVRKHEEEEDANEYESLDYSKRVLSEDIADSVLKNREHTKEVDFDEFFIRHVFAKNEEKTVDENKNVGVNQEQNAYVKSCIKQILVRTNKIEKAKALREKRKKEELEKKKREIEEARLKANREREELVELRRVREMYNERMNAGVARERERKEQVKIKYYKKTPRGSNKIDELPENSAQNNIESIANDITVSNQADNNLSANITNITDDISENSDTVLENVHNDHPTRKINESSLQGTIENTEFTVNEADTNKSTEHNKRNDDIETEDLSDIDQNPQDLNTQKDLIHISDLVENNEKISEIINHSEFGFINTDDDFEENNSSHQDCDDASHQNEHKAIENNNTSLQELNLRNDDSINHDENVNSDDGDSFDQPLLERRVKNKRKCKKNLKTDDNYDSDEELDDSEKVKKMEFKTMCQCYVCFKLYQSKQALIDHCKEHFDICHERTLTKCPMCNHVSYKGITEHMKREHDITVKIPFNKIKDRKNNKTGSRYCYDVDGTTVEVIPSVRTLNKVASDEIDKKRRDINDKSIAKAKLVKIGNEWVVEKEAIDIKFDEIPELSDRELHKLKVTDNDVDRLGQLSYLAKKRGLKMMFPCFNCDKICQNFSALKLHKRRHEDNPKPFRARVNKKNKVAVKAKKIKLDKANRTAFPKPIKNKHKCDAKLKEFFESNIRGGDIEFWQFLKIFNKMNKEKVNDFTDLEKRTDFGNHLDYYKDVVETENDVNEIGDDENETDNIVNEISDDENETEDIVNEIGDDENETENDVNEIGNDESEIENDGLETNEDTSGDES